LPHAQPSARSLHEAPVPRVGGLAIWAGVVPALAIARPAPGLDTPAAVALYAGTAAIALVSLLDDWRGVPTMVRLAVHAGAAAAFAIALDRGVPASVPLILATALSLVWVANLYNFMDGSDGIAGVMTLCGFAAYGAAATINGLSGTVYFCVAAATLPFLVVNVPPARMFLGDVGAVPLGFLAAAFGLAGIRGGAMTTLSFMGFLQARPELVKAVVEPALQKLVTAFTGVRTNYTTAAALPTLAGDTRTMQQGRANLATSAFGCRPHLRTRPQTLDLFHPDVSIKRGSLDAA